MGILQGRLEIQRQDLAEESRQDLQTLKPADLVEEKLQDLVERNQDRSLRKDLHLGQLESLILHLHLIIHRQDHLVAVMVAVALAVAAAQADHQEAEADNLAKNTNEEIYTNAYGSYSSYHRHNICSVRRGCNSHC
ncbi:hypothetical protein D3C87_1793990 [compost metagenome]